MFTVKHDFLGRARIVRDADGATIPRDDRNADYIVYQAWRAEQENPPDDGDRTPSAERPVKDRAILAAAFMASAPTPGERSPLWDSLVAESLLDRAEAKPDEVQAKLDELGVPFSIREEGGS